MATKVDLEDRVAELEEENQNLQDKLDSILDIASPVDESEDGETFDEDEEDDGDSDDEY
jgi:hypothetical protein